MVETVLSRGKVVIDKGEFKGKAGDGQFLKRGTCVESKPTTEKLTTLNPPPHSATSWNCKPNVSQISPLWNRDLAPTTIKETHLVHLELSPRSGSG